MSHTITLTGRGSKERDGNGQIRLRSDEAEGALVALQDCCAYVGIRM